jgi:hypothetical protein
MGVYLSTLLKLKPDDDTTLVALAPQKHILTASQP